MKDIENVINKWEKYIMFKEGKISLAKIPLLLTAEFNAILIKILMAFSKD